VPFHAFVTGFPGFIGKRLVKRLAAENPGGTITVLVQPQFLADAQRATQGVSGAAIAVVSGDIAHIHLGLAGHEYQRLLDTVTHVFHLAAISWLGMSLQTARRVNVEGTRAVLELAGECRHLERLVHFSSCYVSGDRVGVIAEDELDLGQTFRNTYEQTKFEAEALVRRASARLPVTIVRPSTVVGDSVTGEIDRFEGPYSLGMMLIFSPLVLPLPLPGNGVAPLNVVPVDFVVDATWALTRSAAAVGRTLHLVDPNPMSARRVYELIAERADKKLPRFTVSARAAEVFLRLPGLEKLTRPQRSALTALNHLALYNARTALVLLEPSQVRCPPLPSYLDKLIDFAFDRWKVQQTHANEVDDPLDQPGA
jgi:thioester reductase-like protein